MQPGLFHIYHLLMTQFQNVFLFPKIISLIYIHYEIELHIFKAAHWYKYSPMNWKQLSVNHIDKINSVKMIM